MYSQGIRSAFLYIPIQEIDTPLHKLRNMLTAVPKYRDLASIPMYDESKAGYFGIPRYLYKNPDKLFNSVTDETVIGDKCEWYFLSKLREHQKPLFDRFQKVYKEGKTGIILNALTGCVCGDTMININRARKGWEVSIRHLYLKYHGSPPEKTFGPGFDKSIHTKVRAYCKDKGRIHLHEIDDVVYSGRKVVCELTLEGGRKLKATPDHLIKTLEGWSPMVSLKPKIDYVMTDSPIPAKQQGERKKKSNDSYIRDLWFHPFARKINLGAYSVRRWTKTIEYHRGIYEAYINKLSLEDYITILREDKEESKNLKYVNIKICDIHHKDGDHQNNNIDNLEEMERTTHRRLHCTYGSFGQGIPKFVRVKTVKLLGKQDTYDIICKDPYRNFVANGIVVHNSGKTVLLLKFLSEIQRTTLVIVPTTSLLTQWREMIKTHTSLGDEDIGHVQADRVEYKGKPISIGIIHSVCKNRYGSDFRNYFGMIAIDELHRTACEHFSKVVSMFPAKYKIAASATLARADGMEIVYNNHIGEAKIELGSQREEEVRPRILVVKYQGASRGLPHWFKGLKTVQKRGVIISALANDENRAKELVSYTLQIAMSGRRVLVLADRINLLKRIQAGIPSDHNAGLYISNTPAAEKKRILADCNIIAATYGIFALGIDIPDLAGLVFATPMARIAQPVGRILRVCKDKKRPVILDMVDTDIRECTGWYYNRAREYKSHDIMGEIVQL